ncbi:hypothetical protein [Microcoleus vaginatus]|uniref:hypothetical protein n=1 Tax=Microcoleus vaginatus TaxID=119532 RepID=UPI0032AC44EA
MYQLNRWKKTPGILQIISGSLLIALPTVPLVASAAPAPTLNSCPRISYEEPYNSNVRVSQGCPPNAASQRLNPQELGQNMVPPARGTNVTQPPLPETRQTPLATVTPMAGEVSVKLTNSTNAPISYQAIGHTESRMLARGAEIVLQNLPTPVTVTMVRVDGGLLKVIPMSSSEKGMLAVSIDETSNLDGNQGVLRIQSDGQVFLN